MIRNVIQVDGLTWLLLLLIEICTTQFLWKYSTAPYKWGGGGGGVQVCVGVWEGGVIGNIFVILGYKL